MTYKYRIIKRKGTLYQRVAALAASPTNLEQMDTVVDRELFLPNTPDQLL